MTDKNKIYKKINNNNNNNKFISGFKRKTLVQKCTPQQHIRPPLLL